MDYIYFSSEDLSSLEALNAAKKKLMKEFHPDLHPDEQNYYNQVAQSINEEFNNAEKYLKMQENVNNPAIFSTLFNELNKVKPEYKEMAQVFVHDGLLSWLENPKNLRFWPPWVKETAKNIVKNEFSPEEFDKKLINFIKKLDKTVKKQ